MSLSMDQESLTLRYRTSIILPEEEIMVFIYIKGNFIVVIFIKKKNTT